MPELVADFVRDGGTYMILEAKEGLKPERLNRVQRAMLAAVTVPNLLRLDIREVDYQISLRYDITGKRMLSQCLRSDKISMPEFYGLLLQVVAVLEDSKSYMLSPSCFLLDEAHIFVEEPLSSGSMYFTYVPWKEAPAAPPLSQMLLSLITRLLTCVSRVEGDGIPQLVRLCGDELFALGELKQMLLRLLSDESDIKPESDAVVRRTPPTAVNEPLSRLPEPSPLMSQPTRSAFVREYMPLRGPEESGTWTGGAVDDANSKREAWLGLEEENVPKEMRIKPTYLVLVVLLVDALGWKVLYFVRPGLLGLSLSVAVTLLLGCAGFALWRKLRSTTDVEEEAEGGMLEEAPEVMGVSGLLGLSVERQTNYSFNNRDAGALTSASGGYLAKTSAESFVPRADPSNGLSESAAATSESEPEVEGSPPTVLLSRSMLQGQEGSLGDRSPHYYLERFEVAGSAPERIPLTPGSFVIGRSEEIVQYVENTAGVSRAHVEILVTSRGCLLKDLGSKNGTRLNGESVAPYKEYPLQADDVFILAETSFKFGAEVS
ncbi:MAG: FHA domain-containing protein [Paenibacillaceae bacterium]|nr:FHA domain-containing protein [Paenibacillaceae bacterium]